MSIHATNNFGTQAATQTQNATDGVTNQQSTTGSTEIHNPAAEAYASQNLSIQSPSEDVPPPPGQEALEQEVNDLRHQLLDKEMELEDLEAYLEELQYILDNGELTPDERIALQEVVDEARHLHLDIQVEISELSGTLEMREEELTQQSYGTANDWDGDGLTNEYEQSIGTDVYRIDTDGDGISDLVEDAMKNNGGLPVDATNYASTGSISDGVVFADEAAEAAAQLGVPVNGPAASGGSGSTIGGIGSDSDDVGGSSDTGGGDDIPPVVGPQPSDDAVPVNLGGSEEADEESDSDVETESVGTTGAMGAQDAGGNIGIQDGGDVEEDEEIPELDKNEVIADLEGHVYDGDEIRTIGAELGNDNTYEDVVLNGEGQYVVTVDGDDLVIYHKSPEGEYTKIVIEKGTLRRVYLQGLTGNNDTLVYHNVPQQVIRGATQIVDGQHTYASGVFVAKDNGFAPAQTEHDSQDGGSQYGYDYNVTTSISDEAPEPQSDGAENIWIVEELGRNSLGESSSRLEAISEEDGGVYLEGEAGSQYLVEEYQMLDGGEELHLYIPETVDGLVVKEVVVKEEGLNLIVELKDSSGIVRRKLVIRNGITYGNTDVNGTTTVFHLAAGLNDPLGYAEQGYSWGGQKISFAQLDSNYAHVVDGVGSSLIELSGYVGPGDPSVQYDHVEAGGGNDIILAGEHGAYIDGGDGHDVIQGSSEADILIGGTGHDVIDGGYGADTLDGGAGDDFLVAAGEDNSIDGGGGWDLTNIARENEDGNFVDNNVDSALDEMIAAGKMMDELQEMGLDPDTAVEARAQIDDWILAGELDMISIKIRDLFAMVLGNRSDAWNGNLDWNGPGNVSDYSSNTAASEEATEEEETP